VTIDSTVGSSLARSQQESTVGRSVEYRSESPVTFASAAAAEAAGFRPCQRCRPDTSPGTPAWIGTSAVVSRALRLIAEGALDDADVNKLASRVGIGSRQLRRLFVQHLGASPIKVATTQRLHFARKLIDETDLPIIKVALSSGFNSLRQFNHAIRISSGHSPTQLRRLRGRVAIVQSGRGLVMRLPYRLPFNWSAIMGLLRPRATPGVESVQENSYRRTIEVGDAAGVIEVRPDVAEPRLLVRIDLPTNERLPGMASRSPSGPFSARDWRRLIRTHEPSAWYSRLERRWRLSSRA
jgi:AraC family transcriptional regulator, regulatory protein of adaptative response / DNA-3-methyladenine glycosylase II